MKKNILILSAIVIALVSCKTTEKCDSVKVSSSGIEFLDKTYAFFCTPEIATQCRPLVLLNTPDKWVARYGGNRNDTPDSLFLQPYHNVDNEGDSVICFVEYYKDKPNGIYVLDKNYIDLDENYGRLFYLPEGSDDTIVYSCFRVSTFVADTNPFTLPEEVRESSRFVHEHCGADAQRLLYEMYVDPYRVLRDGTSYEDVLHSLSPDGRAAIHSLYYYLGGNGHGNLIDFAVLQYITDKGPCYVQDFGSVLYDLMEEEGSFSPNFGHADSCLLDIAYIDNKVYYLVETVWWDEVSYEDEQGFAQNHVVSLAAFTIENEKFIPAAIFEGAPIIVRIADSKTQDMHFHYYPNNRVLRIPHVDSEDHSFTGQYDTMQL